MLMALLTAVLRFARKSVLKPELLAVPLCSLGLAGTDSAGSADEKFHSSSSLDTAAGWGAGGPVEKEAKALETAGGGDCCCCCCWKLGWGVTDCEAGGDVKEANWENGGGVSFCPAPLAVLP